MFPPLLKGSCLVLSQLNVPLCVSPCMGGLSLLDGDGGAVDGEGVYGNREGMGGEEEKETGWYVKYMKKNVI